MKRKASVVFEILVLTWATITCGSVNQVENSSIRDGWQLHTSIEGGFSILFPSTPTVETWVSGSTEITTADADKDNIYYSASFGKVTDYSAPDYSPRNTLDATVNGIIDSVDGNLIYNKEVSLQGSPGREFKIEITSDNTVFTERIYVKNDLMYTLAVLTGVDDAYHNNIEYFLVSFNFLN